MGAFLDCFWLLWVHFEIILELFRCNFPGRVKCRLECRLECLFFVVFFGVQMGSALVPLGPTWLLLGPVLVPFEGQNPITFLVPNRSDLFIDFGVHC